MRTRPFLAASLQTQIAGVRLPPDRFLIAGAVLLALITRECVEGFVLVDNTNSTVVLKGWSIHGEHSSSPASSPPSCSC